MHLRIYLQIPGNRTALSSAVGEDKLKENRPRSSPNSYEELLFDDQKLTTCTTYLVPWTDEYVLVLPRCGWAATPPPSAPRSLEGAASSDLSKGLGAAPNDACPNEVGCPFFATLVDGQIMLIDQGQGEGCAPSREDW